MNRRSCLKPLCLALCFSFVVLSLPSQAEPNFHATTSNVDQSIHLVRVSDGKVLYSHHGDKLLVPASVSKLISSAAALSHFGPNHRFTTRFYYTGSFDKGVVGGDLVIVGDGDPLLVSEDLWQIARDFINHGVKTIKGNIFVDNSLFDDMKNSRWSPEKNSSSTHSYDAPVTAFGINFNTLALVVRPGERIGAPAFASLDPFKQPLVQIENKVRTSGPKSSPAIAVDRIGLPNGGNKFVLRGEIPLGADPQKIYRSADNPTITAGEYIRVFLKEQGIEVQGSTRAGTLPHNANMLMSYQGKELSQIIRGLLFYSNNYIADVLVNRLGANITSKESTWQRGLTHINTFLVQEMNWSGPFTYASGSGLSPENRLSAEKLTSLLVALSKNWRYFPEFLAALPSAGESGSLASRFSTGASAALKGNLRAKTGTFVSPLAVSSLAGYFHHPNHQLIAFAIIQNGFPGKSQPTVFDLRQNEERGLAEIFQIL